MIKKIPDQLWFPFWVDKWIFGSMRLEFNAEERAVWIDLMALAAKDNGYIRANEVTPYPAQQLAGMLRYPEDLFAKTIEKFVEKDKLRRDKNSILYITNWQKYKLTDSYKRVLKHRGILPDETPGVSNETRRITQIKSNHIQIKSNHIINAGNSGDRTFEEIWKKWPRKEDKGKAREKYNFLVNRMKIEPERLRRAVDGYLNCEGSKGTEKWFIKYLKTFFYAGKPKEGIPGTWEEYEKYADVQYEHKPKL